MNACILYIQNVGQDVKFLCYCFPHALQAVFRKAMVLHEMGQVDKALQVFLQCLALDEDFPSAKRQVEKVSLSERCLCARRTGRQPVVVPDSHYPEV